MESRIPCVSVVIPVYKAESCIERCCRSLFEQTLNNMEFLFVDDCSPDNSVIIIQKIAEDYPERQAQIKILSHSPNRGVSYTRQQGMDEAQGEFIIHCDSDDWVEPNMYEIMYNEAKQQDADVVCCGFVIELPDGRKRYSSNVQEEKCNKVVFNLAPQTGSLWSKMIRLSLLRESGVSFPENINWGEDFCVSIAGLVLSKKTIFLSDTLYHYRQNEESITHTITANKCEELINCAPVIESFLRRKGIFDEYAFQLNYLKYQVKQYLLMIPRVRDLELWFSLFPECHKDIMKYRSPMYLRIAAKSIVMNLVPLAKMILRSRDVINSLRKV